MPIAYRSRRALTWPGVALELALMASAVAAYFLVRGLTEGSLDAALSNAQWLIDLERRLGFFWEPAWQRAIAGDQRLVTLANWVYMWGHWPVIIIVAVWLYLRRPGTYFLMRSAFLISGAVGLVIFATFPVAPPRLTNLDVMDTVTLYSHSYRVLQPPAIVNQYAAMPSLHFGWNLLMGVALIMEAPNIAVRLFGWVLPPVMFLAVVLTANHFIIDAIAGAALALAGLYLAQRLHNARAQGRLNLRLRRGLPETDD